MTSINPIAARAWGVGFENVGQFKRAITIYRAAVTMAPDDDMSSDALAGLYQRENFPAAAMAECNRFLSLHPDNYQLRLKLAALYAETGDAKESIEQLNQLVNYCADDPDALNDLAWALADGLTRRRRDGSRAVELAQRACELTHYQQTRAIGTLAAAYAEAGRFNDATAMAQKAIANAQKNGETDLAQRNQELLKLYLAHEAYHDSEK